MTDLTDKTNNREQKTQEPELSKEISSAFTALIVAMQKDRLRFKNGNHEHKKKNEQIRGLV